MSFGVVAYGEDGGVADIVEKAGVVDLRYPEPPSRDAVVGLYCYPPDVFEIIDSLAPSGRGELEITDVNRAYAARGELHVERVEGWWHDGGKHWADLAEVGRLIEETGVNKSEARDRRALPARAATRTSGAGSASWRARAGCRSRSARRTSPGRGRA